MGRGAEDADAGVFFVIYFFFRMIYFWGMIFVFLLGGI